MSFEPYVPPASVRDARPAVIFWYRVYAGFMAMLCLGVVGVAVIAMREVQAASIVAAVVAVGLAALYGIAAFVPFKPWGWTVGLLAIAFGLASGAAIFAVPLLVFWFKPNVKAAFARL